jgi:hypothetical protein
MYFYIFCVFVIFLSNKTAELFNHVNSVTIKVCSSKNLKPWMRIGEDGQHTSKPCLPVQTRPIVTVKTRRLSSSSPARVTLHQHWMSPHMYCALWPRGASAAVDLVVSRVQFYLVVYTMLSSSSRPESKAAVLRNSCWESRPLLSREDEEDAVAAGAHARRGQMTEMRPIVATREYAYYGRAVRHYRCMRSLLSKQQIVLTTHEPRARQMK